MNSTAKRIAIIGSGITGLSAAQRVVERLPIAEITIYEASSRVGGVIQSTQQDGFLMEHSADSFLVSDELPWAGQLCEKLNLELVPTTARHRRALILRGGKFYPVPDGLQLLSVRKLVGILATPLLSWRGKLRVAAERFVAAKTDDREESLQQFAIRRFGREMFERVIQPLVGGIYTADPEKLSVSAALPQFVSQEKQYGSLARAAAASRSAVRDRGARYSLFRSPRDGMQSLVSALEQHLHAVEIRKNTCVREIRQSENGWTVFDEKKTADKYDAVVCATPASVAARLVKQLSSRLSTNVDSIEHVSTAVVCLGYHRSQVSHRLGAFGCVVPAIENRKILAISFANVKFPPRAPADDVLLRVFVGGALQEELASLDDETMLSMVRNELADLLGVEGEPVTSKIIRWPRTTPQYHLGHLKRVEEIGRLVEDLDGFEIAGNAYRGVGIPQCVRSGWEAADRVVSSQ